MRKKLGNVTSVDTRDNSWMVSVSDILADQGFRKLGAENTVQFLAIQN